MACSISHSPFLALGELTILEPTGTGKRGIGLKALMHLTLSRDRPILKDYRRPLWIWSAVSTSMCTILIIDDEPDVREVVGMTLAAMGHEVREAENGLVALELLAQNADNPPCLLFVDLRMPVLDGWDLIANLRRDTRWQGIPIIVFSASIQPGAPSPVLAASAFWPKPPSPEQLETVHEYCRLHGHTWRSDSSVRRRVLDAEEGETIEAAGAVSHDRHSGLGPRAEARRNK
jgi:two-component system chemotaxis response regulator CheY